MQAVFHLLSGDEDEQRLALTIAQNLLEDDSVEIDDVAVVAQAGGVGALLADGGSVDAVESLLEADVAVRACGNTLQNEGREESDLVDGVETVPSGVGEVVRLQDDGYAYVRP